MKREPSSFGFPFPKISRFEGRIMLAILLCATVPFLISLIFIPSIIESRLAMSMHAQVEEQLEASALFYRDFFDAKKREYAARAEAIALAPALSELVKKNKLEAIDHHLQRLMNANIDIRSIRIVRENGEVVMEQLGPPQRLGPQFLPRTVVFPINARPFRLETVFILSERFLNDRKRAEELALVYETTRKLESERARSFYLAYFGILMVAVGLSLGVGWWLSRGVTRRVARLAAATERVAGGDLSFQVPVIGRDEIARLTRGFNRMISDVSEARDRIVYLEKVSGWQDLARRLAHEIKNPLTPIRLAVQELRKRARTEGGLFENFVVDLTEVVDEEVESLTRLVDEFSQFARLPAVIPARVHLQSFLQGFLRAYAKYRDDANIQLIMPTLRAEVPIDQVLLRRVLVNLVDNAIDASPNHPVNIRIVANVDRDNGRCSIQVEDGGPGIPPDLISRIFEPYFTTKETGTGLGLAIVKKIVLQHGGTITLSRSPLGGATFSINLPPVPSHLPPYEEDEEVGLG
ncbi:MAG: HAMP domain-containing protein [Myxococcales bacterium]|nr:HAMP domain-containing protein [Myxococcales bacterium]